MSSLRSNASFLRLFVGRLVTNAGDSLYLVAAMWLVYELSGSSFYTGVAGFLLFAAQPLQFLAGPLVDRWPLRRVLVGTQVVQFVGVLLVPVAAVTGHLSVWVVLLVVPVLELLNQFVYPAQHAALPRIVDDDQLVRANSLFSFAFQGADVVFNAAAGALVAAVGAVTLYLVDAVTFAAALVLFWGLSVPGTAPDGPERDDGAAQERGDGQTQESDDGRTAASEGTAADEARPGEEQATGAEEQAADDEEQAADGYLDELREGFAYVRGSVLLAVLLGAAVANFAYGMMVAVLPAFAASLGGPAAYGLLTAAMAAGSLAGSVGASLVEGWPCGRVMIVAWAASAVCWAGALVVPGFPATAALFFAAWVPAGVAGVLDNSMVQSAVDDALLGRVSSLSTSLGTVMMPVGALLGGAAAGAVGPAAVLSGMALSTGFLSVYYLSRPRLRSLPPVDAVDEAALGLRRDDGAGGAAGERAGDADEPNPGATGG